MVTQNVELSSTVIPAIGETAGRVWQVLSKEGQLKLATLQRRVETSSPMLHLALGWLAREDKVEIIADGRGYRVQLR